jgi:hypothetical protein
MDNQNPKKVELKPSASFLQDIQKSTTKENVVIQKTSPTDNIYPDSETTPLLTPVKKTNDKPKRIYSIVPSLRPFSIVLLILGILLFSNLLQTHIQSIHQTTELHILNIVRPITLVLPLISAIVFLISKSVTFVKALLAALVLNFLLGVIDAWYLAFRFHIVSASFATIIVMIIQVVFLVWSWSVFSQVNDLY